MIKPALLSAVVLTAGWAVASVVLPGPSASAEDLELRCKTQDSVVGSAEPVLLTLSLVNRSGARTLVPVYSMRELLIDGMMDIQYIDAAGAVHTYRQGLTGEIDHSVHDCYALAVGDSFYGRCLLWWHNFGGDSGTSVPRGGNYWLVVRLALPRFSAAGTLDRSPILLTDSTFFRVVEDSSLQRVVMPFRRFLDEWFWLGDGNGALAPRKRGERFVTGVERVDSFLEALEIPRRMIDSTCPYLDYALIEAASLVPWRRISAIEESRLFVERNEGNPLAEEMEFETITFCMRSDVSCDVQAMLKPLLLKYPRNTHCLRFGPCDSWQRGRE